MRKILFLIILIHSSSRVLAQNQINYYNFGQVPNAILSNPAYDLGADYHIGIPALSGLTVDAGSSGIVLNDLFANNSVPFEDKLKTAVDQMSKKDIFLLNQKTDVINIGYKYDSETYLSFGYYQELDFYSNFPKSISEFIYEGTRNVGKSYTIEGFNFQADMLGVYHIGIQRKQYSKIGKDYSDLDFSTRLKIYTGALNVRSTKNKGHIYTYYGQDNFYRHGVSLVDAGYQTSGFPSESAIGYDIVSSVSRKLFFSKNLGIGFDFGMNYNINYYTDLSISLTDLGFLYYTQDIYSLKLQGSFRTEGIGLEYDPNNPIPYWENLQSDFEGKTDYMKNNKSYISWRPTLLTGFLKHSLGNKRPTNCNYGGSPNSKINESAIGVLVRAQKRPEKILFGASLFYENNFRNVLRTRVSYTVDRFSYTNIGIATSLQVGKINMFVGANNIIGFVNLGKANVVSGQFGLSVLID